MFTHRHIEAVLLQNYMFRATNDPGATWQDAKNLKRA